MGLIRTRAILMPRIDQQSQLKGSIRILCRCFHTGPVVKLPNPYSKRPTEFPQPADKLPAPPRTHPEHGLYKFFRNKKSVTPAYVLENHGRPWTAEELRRKSFEDLHVLWYKCLLERNIIATEAQDARRQGVFFAIEGVHSSRIAAVKRTMQRIKFVLWERYRAWWGAHELNEEDPLLLDRMKAEERLKKIQAIAAARAKMSKTKLRKIELKKKRQFQKRQKRRELAKIMARQKELQDAKDAKAMEEFQRLAAGRGPEDSKSD